MDTNPTPDDVTTIGDDEEVDDVKEEVLIGDDSITVVREEHCTRRGMASVRYWLFWAGPLHLGIFY